MQTIHFAQENHSLFTQLTCIFFNLNVLVTDSPYADRAGDRKESIKSLMKELSRDAKSVCSSKDKGKDAAASSAAASDVESVKSSTTESMFQRTRSLRLFRTVSHLFSSL